MSATGYIEVEDVWKTFRVFQNRNTTLKQALLRRGRDEFEEFWALKDVSFTVPPGSTFGFVGANGAGKSTMLKVLARILVPDRGAVEVNGRISALLELGAGFHPELSGRENIYLNGSILGMSQASLRKKFDEIVEFAGLEKFIEQPVKTYSSGMFSRLGFSVAVAVEPDILLVDEVLAVGDEQFQRRCAEKMDELRTGGRTVVLVSHGLGQVRQLCDQAAWLDHGSMKMCGPTEEVVDAYLSSVTTAYRLDDQGRQRTGTGEVELEVEMLTTDDDAQHMATGEPLTIRFHWKAATRVDDVVFVFTLRAGDGYELGGAGTFHELEPISVGPGSGHIDFVIPRFPVLPGSYHLGAAVHDRGSGHVYDHSPNIASFDVGPGDQMPQTGVIDLAGSWHATGVRRA